MKTIVVADWDDPDVKSLANATPELSWLRLGLPADRYDVSVRTDGSWTLTAEDGEFSSHDFSAANRVVFRRWRSSPPRATVEATPGDDKVLSDFLSRQWSATILGIMKTSYSHKAEVWSRDPALLDLKLVTIDTLREIVNVPPTVVGRSHSEKGEANLVIKQVAVDQSFGGGRVTTLPISPVEASIIQPAPMFYQSLISSTTEIRLAYSYGQCSAVARRFDRDIALSLDRRFASAQSEERVVSRELEQAARLVADRLALKMYTADIIVDEYGSQWWTDVNPDGLFGAGDDSNGSLAAVFHSTLSGASYLRWVNGESSADEEHP